MRFRLGLIIGFGVGYYLGTAAGRERHEQLNRWIRRAKESDAFETAAEKTKAVVDLGVERARDMVEDAKSDDVPDRASQYGTIPPVTPVMPRP